MPEASARCASPWLARSARLATAGKRGVKHWAFAGKRVPANRRGASGSRTIAGATGRNCRQEIEIEPMERKVIHSKESSGAHGCFALEISVGATKLPDLAQDEIQKAVYEASERIEAEVMAAIIASDPTEQQAKAKERQELLALFPAPIFVEEIPNGYCARWCCRHRPWFIVTTTIGRFVIGWRKRVIEIHWEQTRGTKTAEEIFYAEPVTKDKRMIHAWSLVDARRYIETIFSTATIV